MGRSARILVVDDDDAIRLLTREALRCGGFTVLEADCGVKALSVLATQRVDLVLLDVSMPGMDGREVARLIRGNRQTKDVPILMLSGLDSDDDQWEGWRTGIDLYLTKPVDDDLLCTHVRRLLNSRTA